jgi:hypothetical protein
MYGIIYNIEDTPNDNVWTHGREIELNDNSIVYGYEGQTDVSDVGVSFENAEAINVWLSENRKQTDLEII